MDKNAIKKYAVWARRELIERVSQCAYQYGVLDDNPNTDEHRTMEGRPLSEKEQRQRERLVAEVKAHGYQQTMEAAAYTWFNRFAGIRFMEVNGCLPSGVRVFSGDDGTFQPEILKQCVTMDEDWLDKEKIFALKEASDTDELYKYLVIAQCNALGEILPAMFERIADWTELLFPEHLLREGSVLSHLVTDIAEDDWRDAVQIIGWLYQYYNTEPKDDVFAALKKNKKITKETIPAATQLFTPDWIVRYMVENSLGRYWLERHPECSAEEFGWRYYLPEAEQTPEVAAKLASIREASAGVSPEDIRFIDPCMGSGHILVYAFDVLYQIYKKAGYQPRKIAALILQNNLYGLDIDDRAYQLATFAVMMKARQYDKGIFRHKIEPHLTAIQESNTLTKWEMQDELALDTAVIEEVNDIIDEFHDAKEYGSLLTVEAPSGDLLDRWDALREKASSDLMLASWMNRVDEMLPHFVMQAKLLSETYDVVGTNPPYLGTGKNEKLIDFLQTLYFNGKSDLFAAFIERCNIFTKLGGYQAMITQQVWMFNSSYKKLRHQILEKKIVNLVHLGAHAFDEIKGEKVQTTTFVIQNTDCGEYMTTYVRLSSYLNSTEKEREFSNPENRYLNKNENFFVIQDWPVSYWVSNRVYGLFNTTKKMSDFGPALQGAITGDNDRFLKLWFEVSNEKSSWSSRCTSQKWFPHCKGGGYRKWYGLNEYVINWESNGYEIKNFVDENGKLRSRPQNLDYFFKTGITWSDLTTGSYGARYVPPDFTFNVTGPMFFPEPKNLPYLIGYMNSPVFQILLDISCTGLHYQNGILATLPAADNVDEKTFEQATSIAKENIAIAKSDWDSFETSWDFMRHPLLAANTARLADAYSSWQATCEERFTHLRANEEDLNRLFIDIYGLADELTPDVAEKNVTVARIYDSTDDIPESMKGNGYVLTKEDVAKSLLSYAVGCMFGRYSLDEEGLVYAGGEWDASRYHKYQPDHDDIIPICDDDYFEDDIVGRFCQWMQAAFGAEHLEENLKWVADALGGSGSPREIIRKYFLSGFFADHCKRYQKRPIYWLFDAGGKNSFKALMYVHRYDRDTVARLRTGYVYKQQEFFKTKVNLLEQRVDKAASTSERNKAKKELKRISTQLDEIHAYEEKVHHLADRRIEIDLDDGVKHNYALFQDILATIK